MNIDTGKWAEAPSASALADGSKYILFDQTSTYNQSGVIQVHPDTSILISGYNLPANVEFLIEKVVMEGGAMPSGRGCCGGNAGTIYEEATAAVVKYRNVMMLGGYEWMLTANRPQVMISVPGQYLLTINDASLLSELYVEYEVIPGRQVLPYNYFAGA